MNTAIIAPQEESQEVPWSFLYLLRESRLLSDDHLNEVERLVGTLTMPELTAQLLENQWLTPYQLQRIREGQVRGLVLGQYRVLDELGEGGFGTVYKALHGLMRRVAAVKVIAPGLAQKPRIRNLFLREVSAMTRLAHPNIALAYDANQTDDVLWFAMEHVDGPNLAQFVAAHGPLPIPMACAVMGQVARALQFAHENGMVHRDVKPANLLLPGASPLSGPAIVRGAADGVLVKVVDFGLAKLFPSGAAEASSICQAGGCVGTPEFMSPEQARNSHQVDIRSDLYSLGCAFYFALTGRPPFQGGSTAEIVAQHLEKEPPPLLSLRPETPSAVANVVHRLLCKKRERRFSAPTDFIESLNLSLRESQNWLISAPGGRPDQVPSPPEVRSVPSSPYLAPAAGAAPEEEHFGSRPIPPTASQERGSINREPFYEEKDPLYPLWEEWCAVVAALAEGRATGWNEQEYAAAYKVLMARLRAVADSPSHPQAALHARLATLVEPWLRLRALRELDPRTLTALSQTCQALDAEWCSASRSSSWTWLVFLGLVIGVAVVLAGFSFQGWR